MRERGDVMNACLRAAGLLAVTSVIAVAPPAAAEMPAHSGVTCIGDTQLSPRLNEITLTTDALITHKGFLLGANPTGQTKVRVLLPAGYDPKGARRYPVLYLFHGGGENQTAWTSPADKGKAEELTVGLPLIVVMPDGGVAGAYSDWYDGGPAGSPKWQTYHLEQLIPWIDAHYRTIANRNGRATAGLSMGGGGLRYAEQRPDLIGATASFSGDIDILQPASDWHKMGAPISRMIWGDLKTQEVRWRGANGVDRAKNLVNTDVAIFTGDTRQPEGTYIIQGAKAVHEALDGFGIANRFTLYSGMTHSWPTWNRALAAWLPSLMAHFRGAESASPVPPSFTYSTISSSYSLYGWQVAMNRKALEFSTLEVVNPRQFILIGSGSATVRSSAIGRANARYRVTLTDPQKPAAARTMTLRADRSGRLSVPIDLGRANAFQQYSPEAKAQATGPSPDDTPFPLFDNGSRFYQVKVDISRGA